MHAVRVKNKYAQAVQLACDQGGVVTREQLLDLEISPSAIDRRARSFEWDRIHRSIYEIMTMQDVKSRLRAVVVILPTAVVSHESAAEVHGFELDELERGLVTVSVISETTHLYRGTTVHRNSDLLPHHIHTIDGLPVTSQIRTVFDLSYKLGKRRTIDLLDQQRVLKRISMTEIRAMTLDLARQGKPGSTIFKEYGESMNWSDDKSPLHRMATDLIRDSELPRPEEEYSIPWEPWRRFDLAYPDARLAIELDGYRYHSTQARFQADRSRDREAHRNGWFVLRFTWDDIANRPEEVKQHIRDHLAKAGSD